MFERFDGSARRALFFSRYEAGLRGSAEIRSEHLLLGALRDSLVVRSLLASFGIPAEALLDRWPARGEAATVSSSAELPLADDAVHILRYALEEADARGATPVTVRELVLAILRVPESEAARELTARGVTYGGVSAWIERKTSTPVALRDSHYAMLDDLAARVGNSTREALVFAIMDAVAGSSFATRSFPSVEAFAVAMTEALLNADET